VARELEDSEPTGGQKPQKLTDVSARVSRLDVLQHDVRVDEAEVRITKSVQIIGLVEDEAAAFSALAMLSSFVDHRRGNIDAHDLVEVASQRLSDPPNATSEIESSSVG
jgi:hypothetical protein